MWIINKILDDKENLPLPCEMKCSDARSDSTSKAKANQATIFNIKDLMYFIVFRDKNTETQASRVRSIFYVSSVPNNNEITCTAVYNINKTINMQA